MKELRTSKLRTMSNNSSENQGPKQDVVSSALLAAPPPGRVALRRANPFLNLSHLDLNRFGFISLAPHNTRSISCAYTSYCMNHVLIAFGPKYRPASSLPLVFIPSMLNNKPASSSRSKLYIRRAYLHSYFFCWVNKISYIEG